MKIKKYSQFNEAVGAAPVGKMGPNYGDEINTPMKRPGLGDVFYSDLFGKAVTHDEYQDLYNQYKKNLGPEILLDFTPENLDKVLSYLEQIQKNESIDTSEEEEDEQMIEDIFKSLTTDGDFTYHLQKRRGPTGINLLKIQKDVSKTDNLFFFYKDIKDEVCHLVSYLQKRYYNTIIEKRWDDGKYGVNPQAYTGKDSRGNNSILTSVEVIYRG